MFAARLRVRSHQRLPCLQIMPARDVFIRSLPVSLPREGTRSFSGTVLQLKMLKTKQMLKLLVDRFVTVLEPLLSAMAAPLSSTALLPFRPCWMTPSSSTVAS